MGMLWCFGATLWFVTICLQTRVSHTTLLTWYYFQVMSLCHALPPFLEKYSPHSFATHWCKVRTGNFSSSVNITDILAPLWISWYLLTFNSVCSLPYISEVCLYPHVSLTIVLCIPLLFPSFLSRNACWNSFLQTINKVFPNQWGRGFLCPGLFQRCKWIV